ncbi:MAG: protein kinase [Anaerolineae bacterium]|nr:protein kinase [Anaerolineae bacterium]
MIGNLAGRVIKGYELRQLIGEGGFGAVYLAHQRLIGREVAVKIILPQYANQPDFIRRFETEAQLVARLEHPHIVPLYDYWREPSGAYLVMRYLRGGSLQDSLQKEGAWSVERVSEMLTQIAAALAVAHRQGVVHRDLKPENILMDENGNAYLSDFGIAKDLAGHESITQNNAIVGSPAYISPEQIRGETPTPQSDIYMFGTLIYEMLTGEHPFEGATSAALLYKHLSEALPDVKERKPETPPAINVVIQRATAKDPSTRYRDVLDLASDFRKALRPGVVISDKDERVITSGTLTMPEPENPYKGLRAFQQADAADFFGREALTDKLLERLEENVPYQRFLAVVGPSGSGKSSVVKAGLLPALQKGKLKGSEEWFMVEMVPGIDPMEELEATLLRVAVNPPDSLLAQLNEDERGFLRAVKRVLPGDESELLLFVDQFEELFTLVDEEDKRTHFMNSLIAAVNDPRSRIRVIITLRADFYDRPLNYPRFGELMQKRTEIVLPLAAEEIERAITRPAERAGLYLERGLVTAMVADVKEQPGALPLLQYALTELFERRDARSLTLVAYNAIGGTFGALARRADELYAGLGKDGQEAARQMFLRLVTLGEGAEDTRRRVLQSELLSIGQERSTMELVIDAFGRYRLLTFDNDPQTRASTVEVAHEALIRQWGRLKEWLNHSREDLRLQRRVTSAAADWLEKDKDASYLARGSRLDQLETWFKTTDLALNVTEREYLTASLAFREKEQRLELERQAREQELEQRSRNRLRMLLAVMTIAAVVSLFFSGVAVTQWLSAQAAQLEAENARDAAQISADEARSLAFAANARTALTESDPMLSLALALASNEAFQPPTVEVFRTLANSVYAPNVRYRLMGHEASVLGVAYSPDGQMVATGGVDGTIRLWDLNAGTESNVITLDALITSIDFSPDGTQLLSGSADRQVRLWNVDDGSLIREFSLEHTDAVSDVQFSPDGSIALSGSLDRTAILWDVETGNLIQRFDQTSNEEFPIGAITLIQFSPNGEYILAATGDETLGASATDAVDRTVRVWEISSGREIARLQPNSGFVRAATFNQDSSQVVIGVWDGTNSGTLRIYDIATASEVKRIYTHSDITAAVVFSRDGNRLITSSWDRSVRVWDVTTGIEIERFTGFGERILNLALSPNGEYVVAVSGNIGNNDILRDNERSVDQSVWVIDLQNRVVQRNLAGHTNWVWDVDLSPDGRYAVSGSGLLSESTDTTVRIWDVQTGEALHIMEGHTNTVDGVAFSPDGTRVVSGGWDNLVILWDVDTGQEIRRFEGNADRVISVKFSPDGQTVLSAARDGALILWNVETGAEIRRYTVDVAEGSSKEINNVNFSADGTTFLAALADNTVRLINVETGDEVLRLQGHTGPVNNAIFSPDGAWIVSASNDSSVRIWDASNGQQLQQLMGHQGRSISLAFHPNGMILLSGGSDTTIRMWDLQTGVELRRFTEHTNWVSSLKFSPDGTFAVSSAQDRLLKVWRIDLTPDTLLEWLDGNRYIRPLSCNEQVQYRIPLAAECTTN